MFTMDVKQQYNYLIYGKLIILGVSILNLIRAKLTRAIEIDSTLSINVKVIPTLTNAVSAWYISWPFVGEYGVMENIELTLIMVVEMFNVY